MDLIDTLNNYSWYEKFDLNNGKKHLSASSFSKDPLELWLGLQNYKENAPKLSDATLGSIVHLGLEKIIKELDEYKYGQLIVEQRIVREMENWTVSGTPDLIDVENKVIYDYKTGKNYSKKMLDKEGSQHSYAIQIAIYNWLLGGGYEAKILWLMKDSKAAESQPVIFEQVIDIMSFDETTDYILEKLNLLDAIGDTMPEKCKDLWPRKVKGMLVNTKCQYYCRYSVSCPHNNPSSAQVISSW